MNFTGPVLIVDDESHVRLYISLIVQTLGPVDVHQADCGAAAIARYHSMCPKPELVMLDINMPGLDGLETLKQLRDAGATCPIVMLTSLASRQIVEEALAAGCTGFIRKDTPKAEIAALLRDIWKSAVEKDAGSDQEAPMSSAPSRDPFEEVFVSRREAAWDQDWFRGGL